MPPGVVNVTGPVAAPEGTLAVIDTAELTVNPAAATPLKKLTAVAPVKFVPVIATDVPTGPLFGARPVMVGG